MRKKLKLTASILAFVLLSIFIYSRYKTKRIESFIGASKNQVEEFLNYPDKGVSMDTVQYENLKDNIKEVINTQSVDYSKPILMYTRAGSVRKLQFWLAYQGDGYYVIEALDINK